MSGGAVRRAMAVLAALAGLVALAVAPDRDTATAGTVRPAVLPGEPTPLGVPFLPTPTAMHVTIAGLTATGLTVRTGVTIRVSDGTTRTTNQYTFTKLQINNNMVMTHTAPDGTAISLTVPQTGSLGGLDTALNPETTVMWGDITNLCVQVIVPICGIQGLLNFFGSFIPLTAGATDFVADVYAIQTTDNHAALSSTNNPVHLPGTIAVTSP